MSVAWFLRSESDARRMRIWRHLEGLVSPGPFALDQALTAIDLYLAVMTAWRPGRDWFAEHCPKLLSAAGAAAGIPAAGESEDCVEQPNLSETAGLVSAWTWTPVALNSQRMRLHSDTEGSVVSVWDELYQQALARAARADGCA